jgi:indolepyruvate ferredoxin oxidoreductase alpha subunit
MTGGQPHPGTGQVLVPPERSVPQGHTLSSEGDQAAALSGISISGILVACGVGCVIETDPLELAAAIQAVNTAVDYPGVSAVVFTAPCINLIPAKPALVIDPQACNNCQLCLRRLGCPSLLIGETAMSIDRGSCNGCGLCAQVCPQDAIGGQI